MGRPGQYVRKFKLAPTLATVTMPDWAGIVLYLIGRGYPKPRIGLVVGMSREKIYSVLRGCYVPNWQEGQLLLQWEKVERLCCEKLELGSGLGIESTSVKTSEKSGTR